jgi:formamidopyrimidine-DNA glycosylase
MPEFAEVNAQVKWLRARVTGWRVASFGHTGWGHFPSLKDVPDKDEQLARFFQDATIDAVTQRGKYVVLRMRGGTLTSHLMFKGRWSLAGEDFTSNYKAHREPPTEKSNNFWIVGDGGRLNFHDPEWKGRVDVFPLRAPALVPSLSDLGSEVLITPETDPDFRERVWTVDALRKDRARVRSPIKSLLLDQKVQAGLGNMYVCEALYRARIAPDRPARSLRDDEAEALFQAACAVLREAIESELDYDRCLQVYKRAQDPAGRTVECSEVGGRDTYWVPSVQR